MGMKGQGIPVFVLADPWFTSSSDGDEYTDLAIIWHNRKWGFVLECNFMWGFN